MKND
jgi:hypothetical protein